ncbi:hypothetical protein ACFYNO_15045 [Kitasatospora sp. NPDC006697]|uniref:hypothetical protein n=1 Tax=unclassified Kitasatospora TaxID=2633591 RepID=UPI0036AA4021
MTAHPTVSAGPLWPVRAELLLSDPDGRVLLVGAGPNVGLPGGPVQPGQDPATTAAVHGTAVTGLVRLEAGRLLALCWSPDPAGPIASPVDAEQVCVYDHPPLTARQVAALTADRGLHGGPLLVAPDELVIAAPGAARRILAALDARTRAVTTELIHGRPRAVLPGTGSAHAPGPGRGESTDAAVGGRNATQGVRQ